MFVCFNWVGSNRVQTYRKKPTYIEKKSYTKALTKLEEPNFCCDARFLHVFF